MASGLIGGRYEVLRKIAEGGMGEVFEARHHMTKKIVALKVLFPHIGKDENAKQRFLREVSAPAQIGHPGIVDVTDSGFDPNDGSLFVAMEFIKGQTMREWFKSEPRTHDAIYDLFDEVLDALTAAHERGIVHRDLKPDNIMLAEQRDGSVRSKILDFGIARDLDTSEGNVTKTGIAMGTPHYMAPEQAMSARGVVASADVWAMGAMLYEALTGQTPFVGETASAVVVHACTAPHPPIHSQVPNLSPAVAALVDRCLEKDPTKRPAHAGALRDALKQARGRGGAPATFAPGVTPAQAVTHNATPATSVGGGAPPTAGGYGTPQAYAASHTAPAPGGYGTPQPTPAPGRTARLNPPRRRVRMARRSRPPAGTEPSQRLRRGMARRSRPPAGTEPSQRLRRGMELSSPQHIPVGFNRRRRPDTVRPRTGRREW